MRYQRNKGNLCSVDCCLLPAHSKGMCSSHYHRNRRRGTTDPYVFAPPVEKVCSLCLVLKPVSEFYKNKKYSDGTPRASASCTKCYNESQRDYVLRSKYGISLEEYSEMIKMQGGGCGICKSKTNSYAGKNRAFAVDHDHETGSVRGILCQSCNRTLGLAKDSPALLRAMADYLEGNS